jgi:hypothetical protein
VRSSRTLACALPSTAPPHRIDGPAPGRSARCQAGHQSHPRTRGLFLFPGSRGSRADGCRASRPRQVSTVLMALYTLPHVAHNMPHRPFDMQDDLCMHSAPCNLQPTTGHPAAITTCRMVYATDRTDGPTHRWMQARHHQGRAIAGDLSSRARCGLCNRGVHPPSQPVRCYVQWQSQRLARLASGCEGRAAHVSGEGCCPARHELALVEGTRLAPNL